MSDGRRRVGLFGGSFDPIHQGHVQPVQDARRALGLERVIYLPTARPPHKPGGAAAPAHRRFAMVELALLGEEGLYASARELTPQWPAYTVETVEALGREMPDVELHLLIGSDSFAELDTWRRWRDLVARVRLAVLVRPGSEPERIRGGLPSELVALVDGGSVDFVSLRPVAASSTELRQMLSRGEAPPQGCLHPMVLNYIQKYDLYR